MADAGELSGAAANLVEGYEHNGSLIIEANDRLSAAAGAIAGLHEKVQEAMALLAIAQSELEVVETTMATVADNAEGLRGGVYEVTLGSNNDNAQEAQGTADAHVDSSYEGRAGLAQLGLSDLEGIVTNLATSTEEQREAMAAVGEQMLEAGRVGDITAELLSQWQGVM